MSEQIAPSVFVIFDDFYWRGFLTTLGSLVSHAADTVRLDILCRSEQARRAKARLESIPSRLRERLDLKFCTMPESIVAHYSRFRYAHQFKAEICFRLAYFREFGPRSRVALYTDTDVLFRADISRFMAQRCGKMLLAVPDADVQTSHLEVLGLSEGSYFNSGILLFDQDGEGDFGTTMQEAERALTLLSEKAEFLDQDALNVGFSGQWATLDTRFNWTTSRGTIGEAAAADAIALHATGHIKPWHAFNHHPFRAAYVEESKRVNISLPYRYDVEALAKRFSRRVGRKARNVRQRFGISSVVI
ncbi:MAG: hypothetical protein NVSMB26_00160 [Beijerinckiaceae bacterium]